MPTEWTRNLTADQAELLANNPHLTPVEVLSDGDILVLDLEETNPEVFPDGFGPYILTTDGRVQGVNYHYRHSHGVAPFGPAGRPMPHRAADDYLGETPLGRQLLDGYEPLW